MSRVRATEQRLKRIKRQMLTCIAICKDKPKAYVISRTYVGTNTKSVLRNGKMPLLKTPTKKPSKSSQPPRGVK